MLQKMSGRYVRCRSFPPMFDGVPFFYHEPPAIISGSTKIPFSKFVDKVNKHEINRVFIKQDLSELVDDKDDAVVLPSKTDIVDRMLKNNIEVNVVKSDDTTNNIFFMAEVLLLGLVIRSMFSKSPMNMMGTKYKAKITESKVTFDDVAGIDNAKHDLYELVGFFKEPEKYKKMGAKIPKGVLLIGPSGVGKTLLARAVAGESGVPFFSCSASEFVELFVGMGASRIRELFKSASNSAPCIIFIDELDAIGKKRSASLIGNEERDQTLNQLLTEMDGFDNDRGIIILGATNRPDILDEALLRPGRFDRKVYVELPDIKGRASILRVHSKDKPLDKDVNIDKIAKITAGFSGADLQNLLNEAAIQSVRADKNNIDAVSIEKALEKITIGEEKRSVLLTEQKRLITAYHEAGHAVLAVLVNDYDVVRKVSIVPRGRTGGITYFEPSEERTDFAFLTREYLENRIIVALGGRIAEEIKFGTMRITTGASSDLEVVNMMAREMITSYGFNETLGPVKLGDEIGQETASAIDKEVKFLVERLYSKAKDYLVKYEYYLTMVARALMDKETINEEELRQLMNGVMCSYESHDGGF